VLEDLARNAAELVGEEIAETGRWSGQAVRALGRTVGGRGVLAALSGPSGGAPPALAREAEKLSAAFPEVVTLLYTPCDDPAAPLTARRVRAAMT
jgi:hypothetical protein